LFLVVFSYSIHGQSLVINEVSQGPSGSKEYVEFLVTPGSGPYQCSNFCLDLRGWIIDDNNGYFSGGPTSGVGIANGAVRFKNDPFWQCIPIGTIILIYNDLDINAAIPANDFSTTDGNCRLILPISSTYFENQTVSPTTAAMTYPTTGWLSGGLWGPISMANGGDSFQVYDPTNLSSPAHGVSWVNNNVNTIIYFSATATNSVYYFGNTIDNNPSNQANWIAGTCSAPDNQTPGSPNNAANATYISSLTNNCAGPLVAMLSASIDAGSCQCNGSATVSASGSIPGYSYNWYNSSDVSINQTAATALNLCPGSYYCVVSSSIGCTDTVLVLINSTSNTITPTFNAILPICVGGTINLPSTSTNGITGSWSPAVNNTATTTYTFTPDPNQCASSTTLTVQVSNSITPTFDPISTICTGGTINLPSTSTNGISGSWSPAVNNTATTTYTFTPDPNQCATTTTLTVQVSNANLPTFNTISAICEGGTFNLPSTSTNGISGSWLPAVNNTATTTYTFTPDPNQCSNSTTLTVQVNPIPEVVINENPVICPGENTILTSTTATPGGSYLWSPDGETSDQISVSPNVTTDYTLVYSINGCSSNAASATVTVQSTNSPIFNSYGPFCEDAILAQVILPETSNNGITGTWNPQMLSTSNPGLNNYLFTPNPGQCASNYTLIVEVFAAPQIEAGNNITICLGQSYSLFGSGGVSYAWSENIQNGVPFTPTATNVYYLIGTDINGCEAFDSVTITIVPFPTASFTSDPTIGTAPLNVNFANSSSNATNYNWQFGDGNNSILENTNNSYSNSGQYTVWLFVSNGFCQDSVSQTIVVLEPGAPVISVPNVFSPNGDGANDEWFISTENISELQVIIFNRWGNQIATIENTTDSWDGKTDSGDEVTDGTYFYKYQAVGINGQDFQGHGFLTLIR
jgi:gliding motility-associated-like protein